LWVVQRKVVLATVGALISERQVGRVVVRCECVARAWGMPGALRCGSSSWRSCCFVRAVAVPRVGGSPRWGLPRLGVAKNTSLAFSFGCADFALGAVSRRTRLGLCGACWWVLRRPCGWPWGCVPSGTVASRTRLGVRCSFLLVGRVRASCGWPWGSGAFGVKPPIGESFGGAFGLGVALPWRGTGWCALRILDSRSGV
jgi:hypothetical protein